MNEEIFSKFFKIIIYIYFAFTGFLIQAKSTPTKNPLSVSEYLPISIEEEILFTKDSSVITVPHSFAGKRLRFFNSIEITVKINSEKNINLSSKIKGIIPPDNSYFFTESVISKGGNPYLLSSDNCIHYYKNQKQRKIKIKKPISKF